MKIEVEDKSGNWSKLPVVVKKTLQVGSQFVVLNGLLAAEDFISGLILGGIDNDTLAAYALIRSQYGIINLLFVQPLIPIAIYIAEASKAKDLFGTIAPTWQGGCVLAVLLSVPSMALFYLTKPTLLLLRIDPSIANIVQEFSISYMAGVPGFYLHFACLQLFNGLTHLAYPMMIETAATILTLSLTLILGRGYWGAPQMGVTGYGLALTAAAWFRIACHLTYLIFNKNYHQYQLFQPQWAAFGKIINILKIGLPLILDFIGIAIMFYAAGYIAGTFDIEQLIAYTIAFRYEYILTIPMRSFIRSTSILVSQAIGEKNFQSIKLYMWASTFFTVIPQAIALPMAIAAPGLLVKPFGASKEVANILRPALSLYSLGCTALGIWSICTGGLIGMKATKLPSFTNIIISVVMVLPLMLILGVWLGFNLTGLMFAITTGATTGAGFLSYMCWSKISELTTANSYAYSSGQTLFGGQNHSTEISALLPIEEQLSYGTKTNTDTDTDNPAP